MISKVQPGWVPHGPYDPRALPDIPPGFFGFNRGWDPRVQPRYVVLPSEQAPPIHHHSHDNRQVHIDSRQIHINHSTVTPELIRDFQSLRDADRQFTVNALSAAANERIHGIESEASQRVSTLVNNMRLAEEGADTMYRQTSLAWEQEASNTVNVARSEVGA